MRSSPASSPWGPAHDPSTGCLLCQAQVAVVVGAFIPTGTREVFPYFLCADCFALPDLAARIELLFMRTEGEE